MMRAMLACCMLVAMSAAAQTLYKSTLPDGRVVYGDKPDPAAVKVDPITPDTSKGGLGGVATPGESQTLRQMQGARESREGATTRIQAAQKALEDAEAARMAGKEPLSGERIGIAGGGSRLTDSYDARQRQLEQAVEKARRDLDAARSAR